MNSEIEVIQGDITRLNVNAIVNAANNSLLGGGGVDGAIHRAAGPDLLKECLEINKNHGGCETGKAVITSAYNLKADFIIHTVGPVWHGGQRNEPELLESAYLCCMNLTDQYKINSIAFPNISTGIYGFPKDKAAKIAFETVKNYLKNHTIPQKVIFCCFDDENYALYKKLNL